MTVDQQFTRAVEVIRGLPKSGPVKVSQNDQLKVYGLYKQATEGDISTQRPGMFDQTGRYKWDSWNSRKGMSSEEAKKGYVDVFYEVFETLKDDAEYSKYIDEVKSLA